MRLLSFLILLAFLLAINLGANSLTYFLIKNSITSWTFAKLTPSLLTVIGSASLGLGLFKFIKQSNLLRITIGVLIPAFIIVAFLSINKPYIEDYAKMGNEISNLDNTIINEHIDRNLNYSGLILIASSSCPHCMSSAEKLSILKDRVPERNVDIYLFTTKQEVIEEFTRDTRSENLTYHTVHDEDAALDLCDSRFPAFIYVKDGVPVRRWFNNDFGYPAYDWVEAGLE
ncbi:MAG: hypothetical protein AB8B53_03075 [Flavobacteriales bacterium]